MTPGTDRVIRIRATDWLAGYRRDWLVPDIIAGLTVWALLVPEAMQIPGFHQAAGPATTAAGIQAVLMERDTVPAYARVVAAAAKVPDAQLIPTLIDPRFPVNDLVLYPDSAGVQVATLGSTLPARPGITATVPQWEPGKFSVQLEGAAATPTYLVVGENWHPDWRATVDGKPATIYRGNQAMLSVVLPPSAKQVQFEFTSPSYRTGKLVTLVATLAALALIVVPAVRRRSQHA